MIERAWGSPRRRILIAVLVACSAILVAPSPRASGAPCDGSRWVLQTFTVETKWNKKSYRSGETAKIVVTVSRPGPYDPAGNSIPIDSPLHAPVEEVTVSTSLMAKWPFPWDRDLTDEDGRAVLRIKIPKGWNGKIPAASLAVKIYNEGGPACSDIEEVGEQHDLVTVRR